MKAMFKKYAALLLVAALCTTVLTGCSGCKNYKVDTSTVFICKDGSVVSTEVDDFDESIYNKDDLESLVDDTIESYNNKYGEKKVKKDSLKVEDGKCTMVLKFESAEDYARFYGYELFVGTVDEAISAGYSFDLVFAAIEDQKGSPATLDDIKGNSDYKIVIFNTASNINVYGDIKYVSVGNVSMVDDSTVAFGFGQYLQGVESASTESTEAGAPTTESQDTEANSASNGSVSEDEMAEVDEDDDIEFEFNRTEDDGPSLGLVYVIFK